MEIRQLKTFLTIAELQSFTRAAEALSYAQSTVTSQIKSLEEELGTRLFERLGRQVMLTKDGESLRWYAQQVIHLTEAAKAVIAKSQNPKGVLTVGTFESFAFRHLPAVIKAYRTRYPAVEIRIQFLTCCEFQSVLRKNAVDVAFCLDQTIKYNDLQVHFLFDEPVLLLASPKHALAQAKTVTPKDLDGEALILTEVGCIYRARLEESLASSHVRPCSTLEVSSVEVMKRFAMDNQGLTLLGSIAVEKEVAAQQLIALPWSGPSFDVKAQLVYHKEKWLSPALQAFIDLSLELLGPRTLSEKAIDGT